ncbi:hypothetical protein ScPMuIL_011719 [Solemya velum]
MVLRPVRPWMYAESILSSVAYGKDRHFYLIKIDLTNDFYNRHITLPESEAPTRHRDNADCSRERVDDYSDGNIFTCQSIRIEEPVGTQNATERVDDSNDEAKDYFDGIMFTRQNSLIEALGGTEKETERVDDSNDEAKDYFDGIMFTRQNSLIEALGGTEKETERVDDSNDEAKDYFDGIMFTLQNSLIEALGGTEKATKRSKKISVIQEVSKTESDDVLSILKEVFQKVLEDNLTGELNSIEKNMKCEDLLLKTIDIHESLKLLEKMKDLAMLKHHKVKKTAKDFKRKHGIGRKHLNYQQVKSQVAIARTRVAQQRRKQGNMYCAVGSADFERAFGLKSDDFWLMFKSWPSNYRFPIDLPSLYPTNLQILMQRIETLTRNINLSNPNDRQQSAPSTTDTTDLVSDDEEFSNFDVVDEKPDFNAEDMCLNIKSSLAGPNR